MGHTGELHLGTAGDGKRFAVPDDIATETIGVLGQRGAGKSNAAVVIAEEMWDAQIPWVAVDPKSDWHGLRSSADGTKPGLALPVFGGIHGDVPLEAGAGALIADLVVGENLTAVLDVSDFSKNDRARFLVAFFDRLYRRHRAEPQARHVFLEEAHELIPQQVGRMDGQLKEAASRIVLQGRSFGLGSTLASQRSARLHKDVLTQVSTLIAMRTTAPHDRKAIEAWVVEHDVAKDLVDSLPSLASGEAWVWSPQFLGATTRIHFRQRRTFDSGATPRVGQARRAPATVADVDLDAVKTAMAATIEKAEAQDPKVLQRRVRELERELATRPTVEPEPVKVEVPVEVPVLDEKLILRLEELLEPVAGVLAEVQERLAWETTQTENVIEMRRKLAERPPSVAPATPPPSRPRAERTVRPDVNSDLPAGEKAVLIAIAEHDRGVTRQQLTVLTGYKRSTRDSYIQRLGAKGYLRVDGGRVYATDDGVAALGDDYEPLPTGRALQQHWLAKLPEGESRILGLLIDTYPTGITRDELSEATGYKRSTRDSYIQRLGAKELVRVDGAVYAADVLFDG